MKLLQLLMKLTQLFILVYNKPCPYVTVIGAEYIHHHPGYTIENQYSAVLWLILYVTLVGD